jgi:hypothetical protein
MSRQGFDPEGQKVLEQMLFDAYRENGDEGVIEMFKNIGGVEIQAVSRGRYVFDTLSGGGEPMLEDIGNPIKIDERDDLKQIGEVNTLFQEISKAIHDGRYEKVGEISSVVTIPRKQHELIVRFFKNREPRKGEAVFTKHEYRGKTYPSINVYGCELRDRDIEFNEMALAHELRHYLDWEKGNDLGGINIDQFNHPSEYNAYMIMYLGEYMERIDGIFTLPENWNDFVGDLDEHTVIFDYRSLLSPEMQKKFDNRLYAFFQRLLEEKRKMIQQYG